MGFKNCSHAVLRFRHKLQCWVGHEPILRENVLAGANTWRASFELDADQERVFGEMKDPIGALREHDDLLPRLLQQRTAPPLPADGLPLVASRSQGNR